MASTPKKSSKNVSVIDTLHAIEHKKVLIARKDKNSFRRYVIKNDVDGKQIRQEAIHESWIEHMQFCREKGMHCAILAPWGHGKSVQIAIAETLQIIGENKNVRIKIINAIDQYAMDRVKTLKNYIEHDANYQAVYPHIKRGTGEWTAHRVYVDRDSMAIDPTIEARGITSTGISGRADILIFDDPVDDSSITSDAARKAARDAYRNAWMSRLVDNGFVIYIATRWHEEDLTKTIIESGRYSVLIQRVSDDFKCINQERICGKETEKLPDASLCSFWSEDSLKARFKEIGEAAFNRGFRQRGIVEGDLLFRHFSSHVLRGIDPPNAMHHYIGVDLSGKGRKGNIITVIGCNDLMTFKWPVEIQSGHWSSPDTAERIKQLCDKYKPHACLVENNAYQQSLIDWMMTKNYRGLPIMPFTTGKQKAGLDIGLPALDVQFEHGMWTFYVPDHDVGCACPWCQFIREMSNYPVCDSSDHVMSFWFAERASVMYGSVGQSFPSENTSSHAAPMSSINRKAW